MNSTPHHTDDDRLLRKRERLERHARDLRELEAIGMDLARLAHRQTFTTGPEPLGEVSLAFARVSRAVRQTFALETKIEDEIDALDYPAPDHSPEPPRPPGPAPERAQAAARVEAKGGDAAKTLTSREAPEDLLGDLDEALEDDLETIDGPQSVRATIEQIYRDLHRESAALPDAATILRNGASPVALDGGFPPTMPYPTRMPLRPPSRPDAPAWNRPPPDG